MQTRRSLLAVGLIVALLNLIGAGTLRSESLVFVPQLFEGTLNHSWFSPSNWFTVAAPNKLVHANRIPLPEDTAQITGLAIAAGNSIGLDQLILAQNAVVEGGNFGLQSLALSAGSVLRGTTAKADRTIRVLGPLVQLESSQLVIEGGAFALLSPEAPATSASLTLARGSEVYVIGELILTHGSQIGPLDLPQSRITLPPTGTLSSSGDSVVRGSAASPLIVNLQGTVRCASGSMRFLDVIDWHNAGEPANLVAVTEVALIDFVNSRSFNVEANGRFNVTGPGLVRISGESGLDGQLDVGAIEKSTGKLNPGHLEIAAPVRGTGSMHVLGSEATASTLLWRSHTLGVARLEIDPWAQFTIAGATVRILAGIEILNSGLCKQLAGGSVSLEAGTQFINLNSGLMEILADVSYESASGSGARVINKGVLRKQSPGISRFGANSPPSGPDLDNQGRIEIQAGQLNVFGGTSSGHFEISSTAKLFFWGGNHILSQSASLGGEGSVQVAKGATEAHLQILGDVQVSHLEVGAQGFIDGPGRLRVTSDLLWTAGGFSGSGRLAIDPGASLLLSGNGEKALLGWTVLNRGNATWAGTGALVMSQGALFENAAEGLLDLSGDTSCLQGPGLPPATFLNRGRCRKTQGSFQSVFRTEFQNQGQVEVAIKEIDFRGGYRQSAGNLRIAADASAAGPLLILGGDLMGNGTINGPMTNSGAIAPGSSPGRLLIARGNLYSQTHDGRFDCEIGGLVPGVSHDQVAVTGEARLAGTLGLRVLSGFTPKPGDRFTVMAYASRTGTFDDITTESAPPDIVFVPRYFNTNLVLIAVPAQLLTERIPHTSQMRLTLPTIQGLHYMLDASDSATPPTWSPLADWTGDGTVFNFPEPLNRARRFYRLRLE